MEMSGENIAVLHQRKIANYCLFSKMGETRVGEREKHQVRNLVRESPGRLGDKKEKGGTVFYCDESQVVGSPESQIPPFFDHQPLSAERRMVVWRLRAIVIKTDLNNHCAKIVRPAGR